MVLTEKDNIKNRYIRKKIAEYKKNKADALLTDAPIKGAKIRRNLHPFLMQLLHVKSKLSGLTYEVISETKSAYRKEPVVYAVTHIGKFDYEMLVEACDIFAYPFAADWELMYANVDDLFLRLNGVLYVDTADKEDRQNSAKYMVKMLKQGVPMLIFPEGIWNLTESLPMMKIFPGAVQAAKECKVPIVPIAIEQAGKHFVVNIGEELRVDDLTENEARQVLRDTLATLKWKIWEHFPAEKRSNISEDYYEKFVQSKLAEWSQFNMDIINGRMFRDKTDRELATIEGDLGKIILY